jgi:hypothetical protein
MKPLGKKPVRLMVGTERYEATVLLVTGHDNLGRPSECRLVHEEQIVNIKGGEEFLIVYASPAAIRATKN